MDQKLEARLRELADREEIRDVIQRYCHGADRANRPIVESAYWSDAQDNHGVYSGPVAGFIDQLMKDSEIMPQMQHMVGNILIRVAGDAAFAESYFIGFHDIVKEGAEKNDRLMAVGRYIDRLERRSDEWRIIDRRVAFTWLGLLAGTIEPSDGLWGHQMPYGDKAPHDIGSCLFIDTPLTDPIMKKLAR